MIAAFDVSLTTGVCWGTERTRAPQSAVWTLPHGPSEFDDALHRLRIGTFEHCKNYGVSIVVIEDVMTKISRYHSAQTLVILASLVAVVRAGARGAGAKVLRVSSKTWRATFLGNGNLDTEAAKAGAMKRCDQLRWPYRDHNAAEAMGLWYHHMATHHPQWRP